MGDLAPYLVVRSRWKVGLAVLRRGLRRPDAIPQRRRHRGGFTARSVQALWAHEAVLASASTVIEQLSRTKQYRACRIAHAPS